MWGFRPKCGIRPCRKFVWCDYVGKFSNLKQFWNLAPNQGNYSRFYAPFINLFQNPCFSSHFVIRWLSGIQLLIRCCTDLRHPSHVLGKIYIVLVLFHVITVENNGKCKWTGPPLQHMGQNCINTTCSNQEVQILVPL